MLLESVGRLNVAQHSIALDGLGHAGLYSVVLRTLAAFSKRLVIIHLFLAVARVRRTTECSSAFHRPRRARPCWARVSHSPDSSGIFKTSCHHSFVPSCC